MRNLPKFRIIYVEDKNDPCHWQLQKRYLFFFWLDVGLSVSSAFTAAHVMQWEMRKLKAGIRI